MRDRVKSPPSESPLRTTAPLVSDGIGSSLPGEMLVLIITR